MSDLSVCNVHAARVCERFRRAVRGAWVATWRSAGGRLSGGAMLLGVTRMMHRSHVATGRRRGGASEQQVGRVVVERRGSRTVYAGVRCTGRARPLIAHSPLSRRAIAHSRHSRDSAFTYRGRFPVARRSSRRYMRYIEHPETGNAPDTGHVIPPSPRQPTERIINKCKSRSAAPAFPAPPGRGSRRQRRREVKRTRDITSLVPRRHFQCDTGETGS